MSTMPSWIAIRIPPAPHHKSYPYIVCAAEGRNIFVWAGDTWATKLLAEFFNKYPTVHTDKQYYKDDPQYTALLTVYNNLLREGYI